MDRLSCRHLVIAAALALAGTGAFAHGTKNTTSTDVSATATASADTDVKPGIATGADTGKTGPYSGAMGIQSTPMASDEDHNDEGASTRGKSAGAPYGKAYGYHREHDAISGDKSATNPEIQPQNSNASPPASESAVPPSTR